MRSVSAKSYTISNRIKDDISRTRAAHSHSSLASHHHCAYSHISQTPNYRRHLYIIKNWIYVFVTRYWFVDRGAAKQKRFPHLDMAACGCCGSDRRHSNTYIWHSNLLCRAKTFSYFQYFEIFFFAKSGRTPSKAREINGIPKPESLVKTRFSQKSKVCENLKTKNSHGSRLAALNREGRDTERWRKRLVFPLRSHYPVR